MKRMKSSDAPYKVLFQDRGLIEETVRLVAPNVAEGLDFATTAALDKEHLTAAARTRLQDKIHRIERKTGALRDGRRPYVLALLEFQSSDDPDMAWRMREYLYLVEFGLRESGKAKAEGHVPDMLTIVVHNGERPWRALAECAGPLTGDAPPVRVAMYATVDLRVLAAGPDALGRVLPAGSRLATLAGLESAPVERLPRLLLEAFLRHGSAQSAGLRRGLHLRVAAALEREGGSRLPTLAECERMLAERRGEKMTAMLDATLARWSKAKVAEGLQRGLEQGLKQGVERGLEQGLNQGVEQGLAQGRVALLVRQAQRRFGAGVAERMAALLADVSDVSRLDEAGEWLIECASGEALLARLRANAHPRGNGAAG